MTVDAMHAIHALNQAYMQLHPVEAQHAINQLAVTDIIDLLQSQTPAEMVALWEGLTLDAAMTVLKKLPESYTRHILQRADPVHTTRVLALLDTAEHQHMLSLVDTTRQRELNTPAQYPEDSAGSLMDPRFLPLYETDD